MTGRSEPGIRRCFQDPLHCTKTLVLLTDSRLSHQKLFVVLTPPIRTQFCFRYRTPFAIPVFLQTKYAYFNALNAKRTFAYPELWLVVRRQVGKRAATSPVTGESLADKKVTILSLFFGLVLG